MRGGTKSDHFMRGGKKGRRDATPLKICSKLSQNVSIMRQKFDGESGITPYYFPVLMK